MVFKLLNGAGMLAFQSSRGMPTMLPWSRYKQVEH